MTRLDHEIQRQEMQGSGWNIQVFNFLKKQFHKTNDLNGRTYVEFTIGSNSILNFQISIHIGFNGLF